MRDRLTGDELIAYLTHARASCDAPLEVLVSELVAWRRCARAVAETAPLAGSTDGATAIDVLETLVDVAVTHGTTVPWR